MTAVKDGLARDARLCAAALPDVTVQKLVAGRPERISLDLVPRIRAMEQVTRVSPRVWGYVPVRVRTSTLAYSMVGIDLAGAPAPGDLGLSVRRGRFLRPGDSRAAVVGEAFLRTHKASVGSTVVLTDPFGVDFALPIVGAFAADAQIYCADVVLTTVQTARDFFGLSEREATDLCVYLTDAKASDRTAEGISRLDPTLRAATREGLTDLTVSSFGRRAGVFQLLWLVLLTTIALVAWAEVSSVSQDERREIGTLKALGWDTADVLEVKCLESAFIGLVGTALGLLIGLVYGLLGAPGIKGYFLGWAAVYPEFPLPIAVTLPSMALLLTVGTFPLVAATVVPAWWCSILDPDAAIRT
jgi:ABC-type lipoprotein release transport system permease subunit